MQSSFCFVANSWARRSETTSLFDHIPDDLVGGQPFFPSLVIARRQSSRILMQLSSSRSEGPLQRTPGNYVGHNTRINTR